MGDLVCSGHIGIRRDLSLSDRAANTQGVCALHINQFGRNQFEQKDNLFLDFSEKHAVADLHNRKD